MTVQGSAFSLAVSTSSNDGDSSMTSSDTTPDFSVQLSTVSTNTTNTSEESSVLLSSPDTVTPSDVEMATPKTSTDLKDLASSFRKFAPIELLPPELITYIFSFLHDTENQWSTLLVCKSWYSATIDTLWFRPNILHIPTLELLLATLGTPTSQLTLDYASLIRRVNLTNLSQTVDDSMLLRMQACTKLERLTLAGCVKLSDDSLVPLLQRNKGILSVDMTNLELVTDRTLTTLATNCPKLQGLYASGCKNLTDESINALAMNCPNLKRVKLNGCLLLTDDAIRNLITRCPLLVEFDLTGCHNITDSTANLAYVCLPQLREYRLSLNMNISDQTLLSLPLRSGFDKLRIMDFSGCALVTDEGVGRLVSVAPRLRNVVLAKCYNITDRGLAHLTKLGRNLHYMHLGHCNNITNVGVSNLVKACNRIQYIDVACCNQLQDQAVRDIAHLPKLRRVGLVKCQNITDQGIHAFTYRSGQENTLERIHLSYCTSISLNAITHLVNTCQRLTHLSLTGVNAFMREDLLQFCREPPPEFTQHQQQVFCVFSGQGVKRLRDHLNTLAAENRRLEHRRLVSEYIAAHMDTNVNVNAHLDMAYSIPTPHILNHPNQQLPDINGVNNSNGMTMENVFPFPLDNQEILPSDEQAPTPRQMQTLRHMQQLHEQQYQLAMRVVAEHSENLAANGNLPGMPTQNQFHEQLNLLNDLNNNGTENIGPVNGARMPGRLRFMMALAQHLATASQDRVDDVNQGQGQEQLLQQPSLLDVLRDRMEEGREDVDDEADQDMEEPQQQLRADASTR